MSSKRNVQLVIHAGMAVALGISLIAIDAIAQTQITRPVRLIVPYVPGGGTDTLSRMLGPFLSDEFGQQVVIDNRAGGSSTIGTALVARAAPDGQTIGMIRSEEHTSELQSH